MPITVEEIIEVTGGMLLTEDVKVFSGISIDSRTISEGDIFFAIKGDKFDGHEYVKKALVKGSGAVVEIKPKKLPSDRVVIYVNDTLRSLQDLAQFLRKKRDIPVVAVTGSNGKTTTKEMLHTILSSRFRTLKNEGNLNNHIGLPLSLARLAPEDEAIVLEMGMNAPGEIRRLCEIALPGYGIITNVGSAHLGRLGSFEAVRSAKLEILEGLATVIVNADDRSLMQGLVEVKNYKGRIITFAIDNPAHITAADVRATEKGSDFILNCGDDSQPVSLNAHGLFNVYNALAAAAAAHTIGMSVMEIKTALETFRVFSMRFEVIKKNGITVINDAYNANPSSMEESVKELMRMAAGGRSVAVLGDMGELSGFSEEAHREIGRMLSDAAVNVFVAIGNRMRLAAEEILKDKGGQQQPEVHNYKDANAAGKGIVKVLKEGDTVLFKGSRKMGLEKIIRSIPNVV